jgi:hypothetical protein
MTTTPARQPRGYGEPSLTRSISTGAARDGELT